jgi:microcystin-dependent protein
MKKIYLLTFLLVNSFGLFAQDPFVGEIRIFAGNFPPSNWALCNGQLMNISANSALFSILGTTYGGDGRVTFALPDLRDRAVIGPGQGPGLSNYNLGQTGGSQTVTLQANNLPPHIHTADLKVSSAPATSSTPTSNSSFASPRGNPVKNPRTVSEFTSDASNITLSSNTTSDAGNSTPLNISQPSLRVNYIIATYGRFPQHP